MTRKHHWLRSFVVIYIGQTFSIVGSAAVQFAILWYLTIKTGSANTLALASVAGLLPQALLGIFAGVWVDRMSRKKVMIYADLFVALASGILGVLLLLGEPPTYVFYIILFLRALGSVFHGPAMQAAIPMLVPPEMIMKAGGWGQFVQSGALMAGPVLGAALMAAFELPAVMLVDVIGAIIAVATVAAVRIPDPPKSHEKPHVWHELGEGWRALRHNRKLFKVCWPILAACIIYVPVGSLFPLMVNGHFGGTAWHSSLVELLFAGGMLLSSMFIGILGGEKRRFFMISLAIGALGIFIGASGLLPSTAFWLFAVLSCLMGAAGNFFSVPFITYIQATVVPEKLGRVLSLATSAMSLATPVGLFIAGPLAEKVGIDTWFMASGVVLVIIGLVCRAITRNFDRTEMTE